MSEEKKVPLVGQFSGPPGNTPRSTKLVTPPVTVSEKGAEKEVMPEETFLEDKKKEEIMRQKTPQEKAADYLKGLAEMGLSGPDARTIMESVLVDDLYEETVNIGPLTVKLRTRKYGDMLRTLRYLELEKPTYTMGINDVVARYNMAASLVSYGDRVFVHPAEGASEEEIEDAFHERLAFITGKSLIAIDKLMQCVHDFDEKMKIVFAEGAPEDF